MSESALPEVLHYVGYHDDRGGIVSVIRALAAAGRFRCVLGVNRGFTWKGPATMDTVEFTPVAGETISLINAGRTRRVAREVQAWLAAAPGRVFHGHSRAGLLVALWLHRWGERRVVVSVHCYGRARWFYRWAHRVFGERLLWYTPAMKRHYGLDDRTWDGCMPNGVTVSTPEAPRRGTLVAARLRVGGAGALVKWKRWDLVLDALARIPEGVRFTHIGGALDLSSSRRCEQELHEQTRRLALEDRVDWLGWQPSSEGLLGRIDVLVVPSDGEPFSMIALEALFAGVPVIATRGGGPEDFIIEGENGWLVPAGDAGALAARLTACLRSESWAGLRFSRDHLRQFSMTETLAAKWLEIYRRALR